MSDATSKTPTRERFRVWMNENVADTRRAGGPEPRLYETPFARVWDEILAAVERRGRWGLLHKDEELGLITLACTTPILRFIDDLTIWVALDDNGLTRVDALSRSRRGAGDWGVNRRRIDRMFRALDVALGPAARLVAPARPGAADSSGSPVDGATLA